MRLLALLLLTLASCRSGSFVDQSRPDRLIVEGSPTQASYAAGGVTAQAPNGTWPVHAQSYADGSFDFFGAVPVGMMIAEHGETTVRFLSPGDLEVTIAYDHDGRLVPVIKSDKATPTLAQAQIIAAIEPILEGRAAEVQESVREERRLFWEGIVSIIEASPELAEFVRGSFLPSVP